MWSQKEVKCFHLRAGLSQPAALPPEKWHKQILIRVGYGGGKGALPPLKMRRRREFFGVLGAAVY